MTGTVIRRLGFTPREKKPNAPRYSVIRAALKPSFMAVAHRASFGMNDHRCHSEVRCVSCGSAWRGPCGWRTDASPTFVPNRLAGPSARRNRIASGRLGCPPFRLGALIHHAGPGGVRQFNGVASRVEPRRRTCIRVTSNASEFFHAGQAARASWLLQQMPRSHQANPFLDQGAGRVRRSSTSTTLPSGGARDASSRPPMCLPRSRRPRRKSPLFLKCRREEQRRGTGAASATTGGRRRPPGPALQGGDPAIRPAAGRPVFPPQGWNTFKGPVLIPPGRLILPRQATISSDLTHFVGRYTRWRIGIRHYYEGFEGVSPVNTARQRVDGRPEEAVRFNQSAASH